MIIISHKLCNSNIWTILQYDDDAKINLFLCWQAHQETSKLASDGEMYDWLLDRDVKIPPVILHDKLMTDAILGGDLPTKQEHSYSLKVDSISESDSPRILRNKMDGMCEYIIFLIFIHIQLMSLII